MWCTETLVELGQKKITVLSSCFLRENGKVNSRKNVKVCRTDWQRVDERER